jgi:hypothetical protein
MANNANSENFLIVRPSKAAEPKYRRIVSKLAIDKYTRGPYAPQIMGEILQFYQDYFIGEFIKICREQESYVFYKEVFFLHQQATLLRHSDQYNNLIEGLDKSYIASYRRILKLILEEGCNIDMNTKEKRSRELIDRIDPILNELLFLGEMIYVFGDAISEQAMVEDMMDISYNKDDLYSLKRKHHYEFIFSHIGNEYEKADFSFVSEDKALESFNDVIKTCLGFEYNYFLGIVTQLYEHYNIPIEHIISFDAINFMKDLQNHLLVSPEVLTPFVGGLVLSRENKLTLETLIKKPHSLYRFLYRPLLQWNIDGKAFYVTTFHSLYESEVGLCLNAFPYKKMPVEWEVFDCLNSYVEERQLLNGKLFEEAIKNQLDEIECFYQPDVKKIITKSGVYNIEIPECGQLDFIIISPLTKSIFITECKNLQGRYDTINQRVDFGYFTKDSKKLCYNNRLKLKMAWIQNNLEKVEEHIQLKFSLPTFDIKAYNIQGIFFINTPTFYSWNSQFRIYLFNQAKDVVLGNNIDKTFTYIVEDDESIITYRAKHPYFSKPTMYHFEAPDDDEECDKYGYPIKRD